MSELPAYKGHRISVTSEGTFVAEKNHEDIAKAKTLDELKKQIDTLTKFNKRVPVFAKLDSWDQEEDKPKYVEGTITSAKQRGSRSDTSFEFRVSYKSSRGNSWHDYSAEDLLRKTPENTEKIKEIRELELEVKRHETLIEKIEKTLDRYTEKELLGE